VQIVQTNQYLEDSDLQQLQQCNQHHINNKDNHTVGKARATRTGYTQSDSPVGRTGATSWCLRLPEVAMVGIFKVKTLFVVVLVRLFTAPSLLAILVAN